MQKFYVTKRSIFFSLLIIIVSLVLTGVYLFVGINDPYTRFYNNIKENVFDSLGIEIKADKENRTPLFKGFTLENVEVKFKDKDTAFLVADILSLRMPFINLILAFTSFDVPLNIYVKNAHININESSVESESGASEISNVDFSNATRKASKPLKLLERKIALSLDNFSIDVKMPSFSINTENLYADVAFDKNLNFENFRLSIPSLNFLGNDDTEISLTSGVASLSNGDNVNFYFDKTYIKTNKNDISVSINNFSPYIERNEKGNQTLYLPLVNTRLSLKEDSLFVPKALLEVEMISWNDICFSIGVDSAEYNSNSRRANLNDFSFSYRLEELMHLIEAKGKVHYVDENVITPLSLSFSAKLDTLNELNGEVSLFDIEFENTNESFNIASNIEKNVVHLNLLSESQENGKPCVNLIADYDIPSKFLELNASINDLSSEFLKVFKMVPLFMFTSSSTINGAISLKSNTNLNSSNKFETFGKASLSLSNLTFLTFKSDVGFDSIIHIENNKISIPNGKIAFFDRDFSFTFEKSFQEVFPIFSGVLSHNGQKVLDLALNKNKQLSVLPINENISFISNLSYTDKNDFLLVGNFKLYSYSYPITLGLNINDKLLSFVCSSLTLRGSYKEGGSIRIVANDFETPNIPRLNLIGSTLNLNSTLRFKDGFMYSINEFNISAGDVFRLAFRGTISNDRVNLNAISIDTRNNSYSGDFNINARGGIWDFQHLTFGGALLSPSKDSYVYLSYIPNNDKVSLFLNIKDLNDINSILPLHFDRGSLMLFFESDTKTKHSAFGNVSLSERKEDGNSFNFNFSYDNDKVNITDLKLEYASALKISDTNALLDVNTGEVFLSTSLLYLLAQSDEPNPFSFDLDVSGNIKELLNKKFNINAVASELLLNVKMKNANFDNTFFPPTINGALAFYDNLINFDSKIINGSYNLATSDFVLNIDKSFSFGLNAKGIIKSNFLDVDVKNIYFPFKFLDIIVWSDAVKFIDGIFRGEARFYGPLMSPEIFGYLEAPKATMWYLWAEKETCMIVNPLINFYGTTMNIPKTDVYAQNSDTGRVSHFYASAEFTIRSWDLPYMNVIMDIDEHNPVSVSVPLPIPNLEIEVDEVYGHAEIGLHRLVYPDLKLDLTARNGIISQPARYPSWMYDPNYVAPENTVNLGSEYTKLYGLIKVEQGAKFMFPNKNSPIINATLSENQSAEIIYENDKFYLNGDLNIKSGDIYYFQKNFLITEGSVSWHRLDMANELFGSSDFGGISINLSSRLRDFDLNGEPTDIYLTLTNATVENIAPHLSSSTGMSDAEIMSVLGQNILPTSTYTQSGISSLVYLSSVAVDVASRVVEFPRFGNNTFDATVEKALGLDVFSIRQRIFYNLLVDVIPERGRSYPDSAFARYLNGTSLFLGKHISDAWFFQTTLNLFSSEANTRSKRINDFFIQGLKGELELALEWNNELASISLFSSPNELSFFGIFSNIGISVKKHFLL